jgi:arabinogalactan oligomer / maltooligosaccharide transport system substrate-binding protein
LTIFAALFSKRRVVDVPLINLFTEEGFCMKRFGIALLLVASVFMLAASVQAATTIQLWTQEGEADGGFQFVKKLADAYTAKNPDVKIEVVTKDTEVLREDYQTASLAGNAPELLWTVSDHAGPFTKANLIQPVDELVDLKIYVDSAVKGVQLNGKTWGVPVANGNHLMLMYNKALLPEAPKDTDEMIAKGKELTKGDQYGFVWNQIEPFWLVPWLGGFGGAVFAADGLTPTLNTPEMVATLKFLHDLKFVSAIMPKESDYDGASSMFKEGKAAMLINGDWSLGDYKKVLGDKFATAAMPMVKATGKYPAPYTSGKFLMVSAGVPDDKLAVIMDIIAFFTNKANQEDMIKTLSRLPALKEALGSELISSDPILKGSAAQMQNGTPMPVVMEMRCNWDAMKPEMNKVLADQESAEDAVKAMQAAAEACVKGLQK